MLTVEGREVANECIVRSGLPNSVDILSDDGMYPTPQAQKTPNQNPTCSFTMREEQPYVDPRSRAQSAIPSDILEKVLHHNVFGPLVSYYIVLIGGEVTYFSPVLIFCLNYWFSSTVYTVWLFEGTSRCCIQRGFRWIWGQRSINSLALCNVPSSSSRGL